MLYKTYILVLFTFKLDLNKMDRLDCKVNEH